MPNEGWKGDNVQIDHCAIGEEGGKTVLTVHVQFAAEDGTVHAIARHNFLVDPEVQTDAITTFVVELLKALREKVEAIHFAQPRGRDTENPVLKGIVESLREATAGSDEPGTQG